MTQEGYLITNTDSGNTAKDVGYVWDMCSNLVNPNATEVGYICSASGKDLAKTFVLYSSLGSNYTGTQAGSCNLKKNDIDIGNLFVKQGTIKYISVSSSVTPSTILSPVAGKLYTLNTNDTITITNGQTKAIRILAVGGGGSGGLQGGGGGGGVISSTYTIQSSSFSISSVSIGAGGNGNPILASRNGKTTSGNLYEGGTLQFTIQAGGGGNGGNSSSDGVGANGNNGISYGGSGGGGADYYIDLYWYLKDKVYVGETGGSGAVGNSYQTNDPVINGGSGGSNSYQFIQYVSVTYDTGSNAYYKNSAGCGGGGSGHDGGTIKGFGLGGDGGAGYTWSVNGITYGGGGGGGGYWDYNINLPSSGTGTPGAGGSGGGGVGAYSYHDTVNGGEVDINSVSGTNGLGGGGGGGSGTTGINGVFLNYSFGGSGTFLVFVPN